ncbi:MAG: hypothetical protein BWY92_01097 [Firmicutes bacterium ADurb.BinA052]|nr:MAG: hypothetical protein BWY92_01097 [Firmicutes bacterium ADurb.BinA052]
MSPFSAPYLDPENIHSHILAFTTVGSAHGIRIIARMNDLPGKSASRTSAIAIPSTSSISRDTMVKYIVTRTDGQNRPDLVRKWA